MKNKMQYPRGVFVMAALMLIWLVLLLFLFPLTTMSTLGGSLIGIGITGIAGFLALQFRNTKYRSVASVMILFLGSYFILQFLPADRYGSKPSSEVRTALSILVDAREIRPDFLHTVHDPPFAAITAALQKYSSELPEHSWMIRFYDQNSGDDVPAYLFNIRSKKAASNHPAMTRASLDSSYFSFEIQQDEAVVLYRIPLEKRLSPFNVEGIPDVPFISGNHFVATVYPHMLDAGDHSGFQVFFYRLLSEIYS